MDRWWQRITEAPALPSLEKPAGKPRQCSVPAKTGWRRTAPVTKTVAGVQRVGHSLKSGYKTGYDLGGDNRRYSIHAGFRADFWFNV